MKRYEFDGCQYCKYDDVERLIECYKSYIALAYMGNLVEHSVLQRAEKLLGHPIINKGYYVEDIQREIMDVLEKLESE